MQSLIYMIKFTGLFVLLFRIRLVSSVQNIREMSHRVFVYGTLKQHEPNHHWLTDPANGVSKFITEARTKNKYPLVIASKYNIPFLLYSPGNGYHVKGEVYEVDDKMLSRLDVLEDHPGFYEREVDDIVTKTGTEEKCWIYFIKRFRPELLELPHLETYSSKGSHGRVYVERSIRDPKYDAKSEILLKK